MTLHVTIHRACNPHPCFSLGNPDGYWQIYWTWNFRAYCLSFRNGFEQGWAP